MVVILLVAIDGYFICGYWWLFYLWLLMAILFVAIDGYFICGYWWLFYLWLLMAILFMAIDGYFICGYWWLFYLWLLMAILFVVINGYWRTPKSLGRLKLSPSIETAERLGTWGTLPSSQHFKGVEGWAGALGWD